MGKLLSNVQNTKVYIISITIPEIKIRNVYRLDTLCTFY